MASRDFNEVDDHRLAYRLLSDILDSTTSALTAGSTYTGSAVDAEGFYRIVGTFYADQDALVRIQSRNDGTNWDGEDEIDYVAGTKQPINTIVTGNEIRLQIENDSGVGMATMRAHIRGMV